MPAAACLQGRAWPQAQGRHQGNQVRFREPGHAQEPKRTRRGVTSQSQPGTRQPPEQGPLGVSTTPTGHWPLAAGIMRILCGIAIVTKTRQHATRVQGAASSGGGVLDWYSLDAGCAARTPLSARRLSVWHLATVPLYAYERNGEWASGHEHETRSQLCARGRRADAQTRRRDWCRNTDRGGTQRQGKVPLAKKKSSSVRPARAAQAVSLLGIQPCMHAALACKAKGQQEWLRHCAGTVDCTCFGDMSRTRPAP